MQFRVLPANDHVVAVDGAGTAVVDILTEALIDPEALLDYWKERKPHLVIRDVNMPGGNYWGKVEKIRTVCCAAFLPLRAQRRIVPINTN